MAGQPIEGRASARAGVAGNPSDALGGAALAVPVTSLQAEVELSPSSTLSIRHLGGVPRWDSVESMVEQVRRVGHDGGDRVVTAAIVTLHRHLVGLGRSASAAPFELGWRTNIPRSVGLAGSSALVIATMRAVSAHWGLSIEPTTLASLALRAETDELGIAAGWMDRAVQSMEAPTLVDPASAPDAVVPPMHVVAMRRPVRLLVVWDDSGASPSGRLHGRLRERHTAGDPEVLRCIEGLVDTARAAAAALADGDMELLAEQVDRSCGWRRRLGALDDATSGLVQMAGEHGAAATSAGSGGAALVVPRTSAVEVEVLADRFRRSGAASAVVELPATG